MRSLLSENLSDFFLVSIVHDGIIFLLSLKGFDFLCQLIKVGGEHFIVHVRWCRELLEDVPFHCSNGLVIISVCVDCCNGELVVVLVHGTGRTSTLIRHENRRDIQFSRPSNHRTSDVKVLFVQTITGACFIVADVPGRFDDGERWSHVCQEDVCRWYLIDVGVVHLYVEVTATIVDLGDVKWVGIKHINCDGVGVAVVSVNGVHRYRVKSRCLEVQRHGTIDWVVLCSTLLIRRDGDECLVGWVIDIRQQRHEVDDSLRTEFEGCLLETGEVESWCVVDRVDFHQQCLV